MSDRAVIIIGLPESGKTTFLAALWHLVTQRELETALRFGNLREGDFAHLNTISARWRDAKVQDRTAISGTCQVSMNLLDDQGEPVRLSFPDVPGEAYRRMWEDRDCDPELVKILSQGGVVLFIHADSIKFPLWTVDEVAIENALGIGETERATVPWHPNMAPTQVQLVDLLQLLHAPPLDGGHRRLAVMLSAWDRVRAEGLTPLEFLDAKLPLLAQYLRQAVDDWTWQVFGLSAQGGEYDPVEQGARRLPEAEQLRCLDCASMRIQLVGPEVVPHDLTEPIAWLLT